MYRLICSTALLLTFAAPAAAGPRDEALDLYKATIEAENSILGSIGAPRDLRDKAEALRSRAEAATLKDRYSDCQDAARNLATAASILVYGNRTPARGYAENYTEWLAGCEKALKVKVSYRPFVRELLGKP